MSKDKIGFLMRCKNFEFFCNNVLSDIFSDGGLKSYMREWFSMIQKYDRVGIITARGFGKTTVVGLAYPLWLAFNNSNLEIMIVSSSEKQAKRVLGLIKSEIERNEHLQDLKPKDNQETWSALQIDLTTGCRIYCRPFTKSIKGERTDVILMDEADSYENPELFFDYIVPTLKPSGKIALISTLEQNGLIQLIKDKEETSETSNYKIKTYPALTENNRSIWNERFPVSKLRKIRDEVGEQYFQKNYLCNPYAESGRSIFTADSIMNAKDKNATFTSKPEGGQIYIGCDFAIARGPSADYDCYTVVEHIEDRAIVKHMERHKGLPTDGKVKRISELYEQFGATHIVCDESGIGGTIIPELMKEGLPIISQGFSYRERKNLLNNLKRLFDNGLIKIPTSPEDVQARYMTDILEVELLGFQEPDQYNKTAGSKSYISTANHDDTVMSLSMACKHIEPNKNIGDEWVFVR